MYKLSDYNYELPESRIAQEPVSPADSSKLLVPDGTSFHDYHFYDILTLLTSKDVIFFNDTKVVKARVPLKDVFVEIPHHTSASRVVDEWEIFLLQLIDDYRFEWLISLTKRVRKWAVIHVSERIKLTVEELTDKWVIFHITWVYAVLFFEMYGQMPLPPYISHSAEKEKRYQTRFAEHLGSVAAPTASLHFTDDLLHSLRAQWVDSHFLTLHVGLGTFKPVDTEDIREYHIHEEMLIIDESIFSTIAEEKSQWKNSIAVGTTVARTLETLPYLYKQMKEQRAESKGNDEFQIKNYEYRDAVTEKISLEECMKYIHSWKREGTKIVCQTRIFIYPGFAWKLVDGLITNFHLPGSTLLMLVASFIGYEKVMELYAYAIENKYRFFSFGDAMLLRR